MSNKLEQLEFKLEKYWDLETCRKSYKSLFQPQKNKENDSIDLIAK